LVLNKTGQPELVLNQDHMNQMAQMGVDPNAVVNGQGQGPPPGSPVAPDTTMHGQANGAPPGPMIPPGSDGAQLPDLFGSGRTKGFVPASASSSSTAGKSTISGFIKLGGDFVNGLIDQASSIASSAVGMGVDAIAPGAGGAASGAASAAIGLGANAAKRGVSYLADMGGILTDSILEQLTPFGEPRWLNTDASGFMPQWSPIAMDAIGGAISNGMAQQAMGPNSLSPDGVTNALGLGTLPQIPNAPGPAIPADAQAPDVQAPAPMPLTNIQNMTVANPDEMQRALAQRGRLTMMQYGNRP
jgi:hypothetical protein